MTAPSPEPEAERASLSDVLLDLLVYAPLGLTLDAQELAPDLARRGRQHAQNARQIGEFAVKAGLRRVDAAITEMNTRAGDADEPAAETPEPVALDRVDDPVTEQVPSGDELAIPEYDLLAASQVVKRLDALSPAELEAVRAYEATTRDRRTILHKIARLQG